MALPVLVKTWQYNVNQAIASGTGSVVTRTVFLAVKNSLKGFALAPYVVRGSGNSVAGAMDGVDRWTTIADLVAGTGGTDASWIVLRQTGIGATFDLMILVDNSSSDDTRFIFITSTLGFTGGSASARPTAADEMVMQGSEPFPGGPGVSLANTAAAHKLHVQMSSDGTSLRVFTYAANASDFVMVLDRMTLPIAGANYVAMCNPSNSWSSAMQIPIWAVRLASARQLGRLTYECVNGVPLPHSLLKLGTITNANIFTPVGVCVLTSDAPNTVNQRVGTIPDMWMTTDTLADVTTFPSGTARTFCRFGVAAGGSFNVVIPWNGTIPLTT